MNLDWNGIEWGGPDGDRFWFIWWNTLPVDLRYFGYRKDWYDGPFSHFGLWFGNMSWCFPWTKHDGGIKLK